MKATVLLIILLFSGAACAVATCNGNMNAPGAHQHTCLSIDAGQYTDPMLWGNQSVYGPLTISIPQNVSISLVGFYGFDSTYGYGCSSSGPFCFFTASGSQQLLINGGVVATNADFRSTVPYTANLAPGTYEIQTYIPALSLKSPKITLTVVPASIPASIPASNNKARTTSLNVLLDYLLED